MDELKLKNCPFCGSDKIDPTGWMSSTANGEDGPGDVREGPACDGCGASADSVEIWNTRSEAPQPSGVDRRELAFAIDRVMAEGDGFWRSCSGCYETNEGYPTGPTDPAFKVPLGGGCSECGGIGAVWDATDYTMLGAALSPSPGVDREENQEVSSSRESVTATPSALPADAEDTGKRAP